MFKLGMSLVFSVVAALVVFLTGMLSDARVGTAFLRSCIAFLCAGAFTYLVVFILDTKGWTAFDTGLDERMRDMQAQLYAPDDIDFDAVETGDHAAEEFAAPTNFQPLAEDSFIHMRSPEGEQTPAAV